MMTLTLPVWILVAAIPLLLVAIGLYRISTYRGGDWFDGDALGCLLVIARLVLGIGVLIGWLFL
jgi:hypothetical protein